MILALNVFAFNVKKRRFSRARPVPTTSIFDKKSTERSDPHRATNLGRIGRETHIVHVARSSPRRA
jgi:hypothetical protein